MSQLKYCQGPSCHEYKTKDRIRGSKGAKYYQTRKRSSFYYLGGNACSMQCERDWFNTFGALALRHFGMIHAPKRTDASGAWYKSYDWNRTNGIPNERYNHYFVNDLLGERRSITEQQYNDENFTSPN